MNPKAALVLVLMTALFSCKSQRFTWQELPEKQLLFGKGGGFTGAVDTYVLLANGQLFHTNSLTKKTEELPSFSKKLAQEYFLTLETLRLDQEHFNHPGNVHYFLEEVKGQLRSRIVWGSSDHTVDPRFKKLYDQLMAQLK